jgi:hypothetical protein
LIGSITSQVITTSRFGPIRGGITDGHGLEGIAGGLVTAAIGAKTIPAYLAFLAVCCFAIGRVDYRLA